MSMRKLAFVPVFLPALSALKNPSLFYAIIAVLYIRRAHSRAKSLSVISITSLLYLSISVQPVLKCIRGNSILRNASRSGIDFLKSTRRFPVEYPLAFDICAVQSAHPRRRGARYFRLLRGVHFLLLFELFSFRREPVRLIFLCECDIIIIR